METQEFRIELAQIDGFEFRVPFPETAAGDLTVDEPAPLGTGRGPNPRACWRRPSRTASWLA